jgi:YegS/Rv2252/BmrU family lipid kinase
MAQDAVVAIRHHWGEVERVDTSGPGHALDIARTIRAGIERIVVLGGDGTLHETANGLLQRPPEERVPLTILPAGTGNDYARMIGTRGLKPEVAVARLAKGTVHRYDVGHAWDEYFINSIGVGFDAAVADRVNNSRHGRGLLAYIAAVIGTISNFRSFGARVTAGDEALHEKLLLIEVAVGYSVGGGFRLTPEAKLDDGLFDICAIRHLSTPAILAKLPLAVLGRHTRLKQVWMRRAATVTATPDDGPLLVQFDGEVRQRPGALDIRLLPAALPVLTTHA